MELVQHTWLSPIRTFTLLESGVRITERSLLGGHTTSVAYASITDDAVVISRSSRSAFWLFVWLAGGGLFLAGLSIGGPTPYVGPAILLLLTAIPFGIRFLLSRETLIGYRASGEPFVLRQDQPSEAAVRDFLTELMKLRNAYLRDHTDDDTTWSPAEELERLVALMDRGVITEAEFQDLKGRVFQEAISRQRVTDHLN